MKEKIRRVSFGTPSLDIKNNKDGTIIIKNLIQPNSWPDNIVQKLIFWAKKTPKKTFLAQRRNSSSWEKLSYDQVLSKVKSISFFLSKQELSENRPLIILSGNDINHALLALACLFSKVPFSALSPGYSLLSDDFNRLVNVKKILNPGFIFASDGKVFKNAIQKFFLKPQKILVGKNPLAGNLEIKKIIQKYTNQKVDLAKTDGSDIAKFLFTSGSTGTPKAVIQTHEMLSSNMSMACKAYKFLEKEPPILVDWMPWSHVAGGNKAFNLTLYSGGTLYIDNGSPSKNNFKKTIRNLTDISPSWYFNVPKGYEFLIKELKKNENLSTSFFRNLKLLVYSGASMPNHIFESMDKLAMRYGGEKIFFSAAYGASETAPMATMPTYKSNYLRNIGVPQFGTEMKLVPFGDKYEVRLKGPHITPGYWNDKHNTKKSFDNEGYFKIGDALKFRDKSKPEKGFYFDGRIAENFKLNTGTWVSVGNVRRKLLDELGGIAIDAIIVGEDQEYLSAFLIPNISHCASLINLNIQEDQEIILSHQSIKNKILEILIHYRKLTHSKSQYIKKVVFFSGSLSKSKGEITDKGSINQIKFILNRNQLVKKLFLNQLKEIISI